MNPRPFPIDSLDTDILLWVKEDNLEENMQTKNRSSPTLFTSENIALNKMKVPTTLFEEEFVCRIQWTVI